MMQEQRRGGRATLALAVAGALAGMTLSVSLAGAEESPRFSGRIGAGFMVIDSADNLNPKGSKANLTDLATAPDRELSVRAIVLPDLTYDIGDPEGVRLFFNADPPIDEAGAFAFNLGGTYALPSAGIFSLAGFVSPFGETWKNPYLTGIDRDPTSTLGYGAVLGWNRVFGSGLRANLVYLRDEIDEDEIGALIPSMARDGEVVSLNVSYGIDVAENLEIRPRLSLRKGEYDGESNSFTKVKAEIEARYRTGRLMWMPRAYFSAKEYDAVNPVFDRTREDDGYGCSLLVSYMAPFDWRDWSVQALVNYSRGDSNITFYDTESFSGGAMLSYHF